MDIFAKKDSLDQTFTSLEAFRQRNQRPISPSPSAGVSLDAFAEVFAGIAASQTESSQSSGLTNASVDASRVQVEQRSNLRNSPLHSRRDRNESPRADSARSEPSSQRYQDEQSDSVRRTVASKIDDEPDVSLDADVEQLAVSFNDQPPAEFTYTSVEVVETAVEFDPSSPVVAGVAAVNFDGAAEALPEPTASNFADLPSSTSSPTSLNADASQSDVDVTTFVDPSETSDDLTLNQSKVRANDGVGSEAARSGGDRPADQSSHQQSGSTQSSSTGNSPSSPDAGRSGLVPAADSTGVGSTSVGASGFGPSAASIQQQAVGQQTSPAANAALNATLAAAGATAASNSAATSASSTSSTTNSANSTNGSSRVSGSQPTNLLGGENRRGSGLAAAANSTPSSVDTSETISRVKLVQRVAKAFNHLGREGGRVRLRVAPEALGSVTIDLRVQKGHVDASVIADSEAAAATLREHLPELRAKLEQSGLTVDRLDVETEAERERPGHQAFNDAADAQSQDRRPAQHRQRGVVDTSGRDRQERDHQGPLPSPDVLRPTIGWVDNQKVDLVA